MDESAPSSDRERILDLVAEAMEALDVGGETALATFLDGVGPHRDAVLARLRTLRAVGLMQPAPGDARVPERLGDFQLLERLGGGGMGVVYLARQLSLQREVALKLIRPDQLYVPGVRERFRREVAIVARLQHEGIVRLYSYGETDGLPWFAMERVVGVSLADVLASVAGRAANGLGGADLARLVAGAGGELPSAQLFVGSWHDAVLRVIERAAQALAAAHAEGVLHRDLKPSNVMVTATGRVVLLDFGLAYTHGADRLTRSGAQLGTVHYMAPEQLADDSDAADERTDVYSLGVVLRELLTLRHAFTGATFAVVAQRVRAGLATPFDASSCGGRDTETVCLTAMELDRARRYPSAAAFARDLRNVLAHRPIAAVRPALAVRFARWTQRHRAATAAAAVAALALLAAPPVIALRERSLRVELEAANDRLGHANELLREQIARADQNLALASGALGHTLTRISDERLAQVPDLRAFCDGVLADTDGALTALLRANPDDPETRLRLAETFARAGRVRWEFTDLPRTSRLFRRALELVDGCTVDVDRVDDLDLDLRLALVYVEHLRGAAAAAAYAEIERRAVVHGALAARPPSIRAHAARCYARHGALLAESRDPHGLELLRAALRLRAALAAEDPSMAAWANVGNVELALADWCQATNGGDAEQHLDACAAAARRADAATPRGVDDRDELCQLLGGLAFRQQSRAHDEATIAAAQLAEPHLEWLASNQPTRLGRINDWAANRERIVFAQMRLGRRDEAARVLRATLARVEPLLSVWPNQLSVWRAAISLRRMAALNAVDAHDDAAADAAWQGVVDVLQRCEQQDLRACALCCACADAWHLVGTHLLGRGRLDSALSAIDHAIAQQRQALALSAQAKLQVSPDTNYRLVRAEILLQLARADDAAAEFAQLDGRLPDDVLAAVPSLVRFRDDPRFTRVFAALKKG